MVALVDLEIDCVEFAIDRLKVVGETAPLHHNFLLAPNRGPEMPEVLIDLHEA